MKVTVKSYGTVQPGSGTTQAPQSLKVEIPDGASVSDLLVHLGISFSQDGLVVLDGRVLPKEAELTDGSLLHVFRVMYGG
jgi:sulfur carrier protein ThiS